MALPRLLAALALATVALAGCTSTVPDPVPEGTVPDVLPTELALHPTNLLKFHQEFVTPAVGIAQDLYEPTMEVSDTGTLYVAAHVIGAATTGTPAYYSRDDGKTWSQLPIAGPVSAPGPVQGGQPPPGDEGFIVAGANGQAWMADIYAAGFTVTGWCGDGATQCYDNRYAYDRAAAATSDCNSAASLNDRPWIAYGDGHVLLVNNPGGGPMQIGSLAVPPATPVGLFDPVTGPVWNMCASPGGFIPGVPAMRPDGFFAVPQIACPDSDCLTVVTGNISNIFDVKVHELFPVTAAFGGTTNGGRTAFDAKGTLFVGAYNNTAAASVKESHGRFILTASTDNASTFHTMTFATGSAVRSLYLDSNPYGEGVLLTWSQYGNDTSKSDWYVAHLGVDASGLPVVSDVSLAVDEGPHSAAHVMGAALGPDGRAYFVNFQGAAATQYAGSTPISVWVQDSGPVLPHKAT